jgi:hypothetical protein
MLVARALVDNTTRCVIEDCNVNGSQCWFLGRPSNPWPSSRENLAHRLGIHVSVRRCWRCWKSRNSRCSGETACFETPSTFHTRRSEEKVRSRCTGDRPYDALEAHQLSCMEFVTGRSAGGRSTDRLRSPGEARVVFVRDANLRGWRPLGDSRRRCLSALYYYPDSSRKDFACRNPCCRYFGRRRQGSDGATP